MAKPKDLIKATRQALLDIRALANNLRAIADNLQFAIIDQIPDIYYLEVSVRSSNILINQGIDLEKLRTMSEVDLLKLPNCGRLSARQIMVALDDYNERKSHD